MPLTVAVEIIGAPQRAYGTVATPFFAPGGQRRTTGVTLPVDGAYLAR
jgi:hypothetical protein